MVIILDTFPVSCTGKRAEAVPTLSDECRDWIDACEAAGHTVLVPAVAYYEALRELELRGAQQQIRRLKEFCLDPDRFIPLLTEHLEVAAQLWAEARKSGKSTADRHALDGDVINAAQALSLELPRSRFVIATTNVGHLGQFVPAELWGEIEV